ncbi:MAG: ATP-binding protein [candidate division KSB1 bacterium]|nr:ATP-binding protein [candidate division KSB1 bacterium]
MIKSIPGQTISKLTIIFLSSILIPGLILVYFSIQTIANQKELTEKRLLEDQAEIARELSEYFQQQLVQCASNFFAQAESLYHHSIAEFAALDSLPGVAQSFIINRRGNFRYPNYVHLSQIPSAPSKSPQFLKLISQAEKAEFADNNLAAAFQLYQNALNAANNKKESAAAINGLARTSFKLGHSQKALEYYKKLAENYGEIIDGTGVPFAYYSLHQSIRMASSMGLAYISKEMEMVLYRIWRGQIPITENLEFLLAEISSWLDKQNRIEFSDLQSIQQRIQSIQKLIKFISQEGNSLQQQIMDSNHSAVRQTLGKFQVITGSRDNQPLLYFFDSTADRANFLGFKTDLDTLKKQLLNFSHPATSSSMVVNIIDKNEMKALESHLFCTIKELSPLVPLWRICIQPHTPGVVNQLIAKRRWVYGMVLTFLIAGMVLGVVLVLRDVSREQRLARLRSDFVSNVSHELKTPLTSIRMFAETMLLGRYANKKVQQEYLSIIVNESARLTRLINSVLDFSKIEKGKKQYYFKHVNLSKIINTAIKSMEYFITQNGFTLTTDIAKDILAVVDADAIEQAVLNLLSNAVKYSHDRKEISVRLQEANDSILIEVADQGIGIPDAAQKFIFDKFYRAHVGQEQDTGGTGLGLTVVKHIIEAHHGKIELESKVGKGSTFRILLPKEG